MLYVWGIAELQGGEVLLRIEDHDGQRSRPEYEASALRDLEWLGFEPANDLKTAPSRFRQSDCGQRYDGALARLREVGNVYRCTCTRRQLARAVEPLPSGERPYPGTCRHARHPESAAHALRLRWESGVPAESFDDGFQGHCSQEPRRQCGDLVLRDRVGHWTYQFAVTVDDVRHGIDFVVRGLDLLESTGRQLRLGRMLGADRAPRYFHHPLLVDDLGRKLGKRHGAAPIRALRASGVAPAAVLGLAARGASLRPAGAHVRPADAGGLVRAALSRSPLDGRGASSEKRGAGAITPVRGPSSGRMTSAR